MSGRQQFMNPAAACPHGDPTGSTQRVSDNCNVTININNYHK